MIGISTFSVNISTLPVNMSNILLRKIAKIVDHPLSQETMKLSFLDILIEVVDILTEVANMLTEVANIHIWTCVEKVSTCQHHVNSLTCRLNMSNFQGSLNFTMTSLTVKIVMPKLKLYTIHPVSINHKQEFELLFFKNQKKLNI